MESSRPTDPLPRPSLQEFLNEVLAEQQRLDTPVVRASAAYDAIAGAADVAPATDIFRDLIPLSKPKAGEQYAFEVNLDACSGCKACVVACHSLNGLDDTEAWRDVGLLVSTGVAMPWQQTVTTACHHCAEPGCLEGCPVVAYDKDPITGIVRHLDDQCIGCSYCILKCPYDVPKYNARLGIVRKCDMCHQRLAVDEAPACVQACPTHAIKIVTVAVAPKGETLDTPKAKREGLRVDTSEFLPGAPDAAYTQPTTRYVSSHSLPAKVRAADADTLRVQHAHWPLVVMLSLTQLGFGLFATASVHFRPVIPAVDAALNRVFDPFNAWLLSWREAGAQAPAPIALIGAALFLVGLAFSVLHLGQPLRAWRVFLGLRTSWLSREAVLFGKFAPLMLASLAWPQFKALHLAAVALGLAAVFCSAMVYIDTRRQFWAQWPTTIRFAGTTVVGALAFTFPTLAATALLAKLGYEFSQTQGGAVSARLQRDPLFTPVVGRFAIGALALTALAAGTPWLALIPLVAGEIAERYIFFTATDAPKMPGVVSTV